MTGRQHQQPQQPQHYFSRDPAAPLVRTPVRARVWGHDLDLVSGSGVFSQGRVDQGTAVLFREVQPPSAADALLDLGCGYGVIAVALAVADPGATVWAVDVNERALALTRENADRVGVGHRVEAVTPDQVPADVVFDEIWSNPPIRIGKDALHDLLLTWVARLSPDGRAVMVVGKNLGADSLQRWLTGRGHPTHRLASAKGFRVLETRPGGKGEG